MIRKAGAVSLAFALMAQAVLADPSRVLVIGGTAAEIVAALGQSERLVARDATATFPPELMALPDVGYMRALSPEGARARWVCRTGLAAFYFCTCWGLPQLVWQLCTGAEGGTPALAAIALALLGLWSVAVACRALGEKAAAGPAPE